MADSRGRRDPDRHHARPPLPDAVLVERAAAGDPHAFEQLIRRHQHQMYRLALRITERRDDAEDATQNAFVAAWRRLPEFRQEAAFGTWLHRIVTNHALNQVRSRRRGEHEWDIADLLDRDQPAATGVTPAQHAQAGALAHDLERALRSLSPELRTCWYAREVDGYSYQQVAEIAGVSVDVARGRIGRARRRVAETMREWQ